MNSQDYSSTFEHELIREIKSWVGNASGRNLIGDDCACLPSGQLVTCDFLVEGTHFLLSQASLEDIGWKACAVNLSDIAAMAGRPRYAVVSMSLPPGFEKHHFRKLYQAIIECARTYRTKIAGGDLTLGSKLSICLTVLGDVHEAGCLLRSGAKPGDVVLVTGNFGASAAGLYLLCHGQARFEYVKQRHLRPTPRLSESWALVRQTGSNGALMDASDGLADALYQIACASKVAMEIDLDLVPIHKETTEVAQVACVHPYDFALYGGEDYELVASVSQEIWSKLKQSRHNPFIQIGNVMEGNSVYVSGASYPHTKVDMSKTFQHWK